MRSRLRRRPCGSGPELARTDVAGVVNMEPPPEPSPRSTLALFWLFGAILILIVAVALLATNTPWGWLAFGALAVGGAIALAMVLVKRNRTVG